MVRDGIFARKKGSSSKMIGSLKCKVFIETHGEVRVLPSNDYCLQVPLWRFCVLNLYVVQMI